MNNYLIQTHVTDNAKTYNYTNIRIIRAKNMQDAVNQLKATNPDLKDKIWTITAISKLDNSIANFDALTEKGEIKC